MGIVIDTAYSNNPDNWTDGALYIGHHLVGSNDSAASPETGEYNIKEGTICVADSSMDNLSSLKSVTIPDSVVYIGGYAFDSCANLEEVTIGEGVQKIEDYAFSNCTKLEKLNWNAVNVSNFSRNTTVFQKCGMDAESLEVIFGDSVEHIPSFAFYSTFYSGTMPKYPRVTSVVVGKGVKTVGTKAFNENGSLKKIYWNAVSAEDFSSDSQVFKRPTNSGNKMEVVFGDDVEYVPGYMFYSNSSLERVSFSDNISAIGKCAFVSCEYLTSIDLPAGLTSIGYAAFASCYGLSSITVPKGVTEIENNVFFSCSGLTEVNLPESLTAIGDYAFNYCSALESIDIPDGVISIGNFAFMDCSKLSGIDFPENLETIGYAAFENCVSFTDIIISDSVKTINRNAFLGCEKASLAVIGENVETIGENAFSGCVALEKVVIGSAVKEIGSGAFEGDENISGVYISDLASWCQIKFWGERTNPLSYAENLYVNGELTTDIVLPEGTEKIEIYAFYNFDGITSVMIPDSVLSIDSYAFCHCSNLARVNMERGLTYIGSRAFMDCPKLTSVNIPESVTKIGDDAFKFCSSLTAIYGCGGLQTVNPSVFAETAISDVYYYGTESGFKNILVLYDNDPFKNAAVHYVPSINHLTLTVEDEKIIIDFDAANLPAEAKIFAVGFDENGKAVCVRDFSYRQKKMDAADIKTVKVFAWDGFETMCPLCKAAEAKVI